MEVMRILQEGASLLVLVSLPVLGAMLVGGLLVAILQSTTQIQEQSIPFAVKGIIAIAALLLLGDWVVASFVEYFEYVMDAVLDLISPGSL